MRHERRWKKTMKFRRKGWKRMDGNGNLWSDNTWRWESCWPLAPIGVSQWLLEQRAVETVWNGHQKFDMMCGICWNLSHAWYPTHGILTYLRETCPDVPKRRSCVLGGFFAQHLSPGARRARWHHQWPMGVDGALGSSLKSLCWTLVGSHLY